MRDKWEEKMLVAEMAAGPCFAPAEVRDPPGREIWRLAQKSAGLKNGIFFCIV